MKNTTNTSSPLFTDLETNLLTHNMPPFAVKNASLNLISSSSRTTTPNIRFKDPGVDTTHQFLTGEQNGQLSNLNSSSSASSYLISSSSSSSSSIYGDALVNSSTPFFFSSPTLNLPTKKIRNIQILSQMQSVEDQKNPHNGDTNNKFTCSFRKDKKICGMTFTRQENFNSHMNTHLNLKPFKCMECEKGFASNKTLSRHYQAHRGEKPYACTKCDKCYADNRNLKNHVIREHKNNLSDISNSTDTVDTSQSLLLDTNKRDTILSNLNSSISASYSSNQIDNLEISKQSLPHKGKRKKTNLMLDPISTKKNKNARLDAKRTATASVTKQSFEIKDMVQSHDFTAPMYYSPNIYFPNIYSPYIYSPNINIYSPNICLPNTDNSEQVPSYLDKLQSFSQHPLTPLQYPTPNQKYPQTDFSSYSSSEISPSLASPIISEPSISSSSSSSSIHRDAFISSSTSSFFSPTPSNLSSKEILAIETLSQMQDVTEQKRPQNGASSTLNRFPCPDCGTRFKIKASLTRHIKNQISEKSHACKKCDEMFLKHCALKSHMKTHKVEKPYHCGECRKEYTKEKYLNQHIKKTHII